MKLIQRYSRSINSSNLMDDQFHHQTEVLAAAALASMTAPLATELFRVKFGNDASTYPTLRTKWIEIVAFKASNRHWPKDISPSQVAKLSLDYWLNDLCTACGGHGTTLVDGVPSVRQDIPCRQCRGTRKQPLEVRKALHDYVADMVETLEDMTIYAGGLAMRKLSSAMDLK